MYINIEKKIRSGSISSVQAIEPAAMNTQWKAVQRGFCARIRSHTGMKIRGRVKGKGGGNRGMWGCGGEAESGAWVPRGVVLRPRNRGLCIREGPIRPVGD